MDVIIRFISIFHANGERNAFYPRPLVFSLELHQQRGIFVCLYE